MKHILKLALVITEDPNIHNEYDGLDDQDEFGEEIILFEINGNGVILQLIEDTNIETLYIKIICECKTYTMMKISTSNNLITENGRTVDPYFCYILINKLCSSTEFQRFINKFSSPGNKFGFQVSMITYCLNNVFDCNIHNPLRDDNKLIEILSRYGSPYNRRLIQVVDSGKKQYVDIALLIFMSDEFKPLFLRYDI